MIKKCIGCGIEMQYENTLLEGYTTSLTNDYCMRCFKINNYGQYEFSTKKNEEYINILKQIPKDSLIIYVIDILTFNNIKQIRKYLENNPIILVINKRDIMPKSIKDEKILEYFKKLNLGFLDYILISSLKNYNLDYLYNKITTNPYSKDIYVVGNTNAGKSTLINHLISNYTQDIPNVTISPLPSTTLSEITIKLNDLTIIDTPGLITDTSILNYVDTKMIKKIVCKNEIKPRSYRTYNNITFVVEDLFRIEYKSDNKNSFVFFLSNDLNIKRISSKRDDLKNLKLKKINVGYRQDIVIEGLGFIKCMDDANIDIYIKEEVNVYVRKSFI